MTRAIGMLVGALLMAGIFLLALSTANSPTLVQAVVSSEADTSHAVAEPVSVPAEDVPVDNGVDSTLPPVTDTAGPAEGSQMSVKDSGADSTGSRPVPDPLSRGQSMASRETGGHDAALEESRYRVWTPFRSKWAASGFARRLALATDVPVEVVNEGPGNYQVVFSYRDDGERRALVEHIETVTGLELE